MEDDPYDPSRRVSEDYEIFDDCSNHFTDLEWEQRLETGTLLSANPTLLHESLLMGIPHQLRQRAWPTMSKAYQLAQQNPGAYAQLVLYDDSLQKTRITKDLARTFPTNKEFMKSENLSTFDRLLTAYAGYDNEIGYTQGMNFIMGRLLEVIQDEEITFWTFVTLMHDKTQREVFKEGQSKLMYCIQNFDTRVEFMFPNIYKYLQKYKVDISTIVMQTYISIFWHTKIPLEFCNRVLDLFLVEGEYVITNVLLNMFRLKQQKILDLKGDNLMIYMYQNFIPECISEYNTTTLIL